MYYPKAQCELDFRDLEMFNMTLLAKQGWRILSQPHSLVAKILKGRYFHSTSFLRAKQGSHPSCAWQSILWGRRIMEEGVQWNLNNGNSILCKHDIYVPNFFPRTPQIRPDADLNINMVFQLMNPNSHSWDINKLKYVFKDEKIQNILAIPLNLFDREDFLA